MVGGEGRQGLGRIGVLHDVSVLGLEIDEDAFMDAVPFLDFSEAPTAVKTIGSGDKQLQLFGQSR